MVCGCGSFAMRVVCGVWMCVSRYACGGWCVCVCVCVCSLPAYVVVVEMKVVKHDSCRFNGSCLPLQEDLPISYQSLYVCDGGDESGQIQHPNTVYT